ncbi:hypothetical protein [Micromonospora sp. C51]|uniref:hypothetical protein n=1 Tax=Micromonospora sp. C51 TaxID=2824879 RepID=UPI001FFC5910|nr:hypothetical protein [Micromonospora sp. C51]
MGPPKERDEGWFTGLYVAEYANVVRYGLRRLADSDASAELAQEVFVVAWRRRNEKTGELLAHERLTLSPVRISAYQVILDAAWTDRLG